MLQEAEKTHRNGAVVVEDTVEIIGANYGFGEKEQM